MSSGGLEGRFDTKPCYPNTVLLEDDLPVRNREWNYATTHMYLDN